jgi:hypothetical protein
MYPSTDIIFACLSAYLCLSLFNSFRTISLCFFLPLSISLSLSLSFLLPLYALSHFFSLSSLLLSLSLFVFLCLPISSSLFLSFSVSLPRFLSISLLPSSSSHCILPLSLYRMSLSSVEQLTKSLTRMATT